MLVATMRRYLAQIGCTLRPGSVERSDLRVAHASPRSWPSGTPSRHRRRGQPRPHRGLQAVAGHPARAESAAADGLEHHRAHGSGTCGCSSSASTSGAGTTRPARLPIVAG